MKYFKVLFVLTAKCYYWPMIVEAWRSLFRNKGWVLEHDLNCPRLDYSRQQHIAENTKFMN